MTRAWFGPSRLVYVGDGFDTDEHSHHAHQVTVVLDGSAELKARDRSVVLRCGEACVALAGTPHVQRAAGARLASIYVAPESFEGRALHEATAGSPLVPLLPLRPEDEREALLVGAFEGWSDAWLARTLNLHGSSAKRLGASDARVRRVLAAIEERVSSGGATDAAALAGHVGLSKSRLVHLFSSAVGIPLRPYVRWVRVRVAAHAVVRGASLTEAAHQAGFADASHLSRTFRDMFGITPSTVRGALGPAPRAVR